MTSTPSADPVPLLALQHVNHAVLRDINVTGLTGPLVSTNAVTGVGLEDAAPRESGLHVTN